MFHHGHAGWSAVAPVPEHVGPVVVEDVAATVHGDAQTDVRTVWEAA